MLGEGVKKPLFMGFSFANTTDGAESLVVRTFDITPEVGDVWHWHGGHGPLLAGTVFLSA